METSLFVAQAIGFIALAVSLGSSLLRSDACLKWGAATGSLLWSFHFALLGAPTDSALKGAIAVRQVMSVWLGRPGAKRHWAAGGFIVLFTAATAMTWRGPASVLPWIASVNATYAYFYLGGTRMRAQLIGCDLAWLASALVNGSWGMIGTSIAGIVMKCIGIARLRQSPAMSTHALEVQPAEPQAQPEPVRRVA